MSMWNMAASPCIGLMHQTMQNMQSIESGHSDGQLDDNDAESSECVDDDDSVELHEQPLVENTRIGVACDDGCVRIYSISKSDKLMYHKSLPRVSGRILGVTWSLDSNMIYSGTSDGFIRCWDAKLAREVYRITVGLGGSGSGSELCIWSLLVLRCGTLVSADSTGSVQFWDSQRGTLLQVYTRHKGDVSALAAVPRHNRVFSAGSDGQVVLYKRSNDIVGSRDEMSSLKVMKKWTYVGCVRAHTHDVRALSIAVPINREDFLPEGQVKRVRGREKLLEYSYHKWACLGVPMLISAGDDTKLFAYSAKEFTKFSPHDICPVPQRVPIQLVLNNQTPMLLVQASYCLDILRVRREKVVAPIWKLVLLADLQPLILWSESSEV